MGEGRERRGLLQTRLSLTCIQEWKIPFQAGLGQDVCCLTPGKLNWQPPVSRRGGCLCLDSDDLSEAHCVNPMPRNVAPQLFLLVPCHAFHCSHHKTLPGPLGSLTVSLLQLRTVPHRGRTVTASGGHHLLPVLLGTLSTLVSLSLELRTSVHLGQVGWERQDCGSGGVEPWGGRNHGVGGCMEPTCAWRAL